MKHFRFRPFWSADNGAGGGGGTGDGGSGGGGDNNSGGGSGGGGDNVTVANPVYASPEFLEKLTASFAASVKASGNEGGDGNGNNQDSGKDGGNNNQNANNQSAPEGNKEILESKEYQALSAQHEALSKQVAFQNNLLLGTLPDPVKKSVEAAANGDPIETSKAIAMAFSLMSQMNPGKKTNRLFANTSGGDSGGDKKAPEGSLAQAKIIAKQRAQELA